MKGYIRRRSPGSWELTVDLGRDRQGHRLRKFVSVTGMRRDAEKKLRELLSYTDKGIPLNTERITVAEWLRRWLRDYVAPRTRPKTIERYEGIVYRHLIPKLGRIELTRLAPGDVQALEAHLSAQGMAPTGIGLVHTVISGSLKSAVRAGILWRNVAQAVTPPRVVNKEVNPPQIATVRRILELARAEQHPLYPCLHLIAYTGIRRGEALGLRWQVVDFESGRISIVQTLGRSLRHGLLFQPPKTNSGRRGIDLDATTVGVLRGQRGQQMLQKLQAEGAYQDNDLVFADPLGSPLNPMALTRALQGLATRIGAERVRLHDLRHFHASVMLQNGQSPVLVSKRLGHASVTTTMDIYAHILPGWQKDAAAAFARVMEQA